MKAPLADALLTPWRATRASRRWFALAIMAACLLGAIAIDVFMQGPRHWLACAILYAVGAFFLWALWLSATLLLAIDARRLHLSGVQRAAIHGLACYAALMIGLPVLALAALPNVDLVLTALIVATACISGLAFALLPSYVITLACLLPALLSKLKLPLPLPALGQQGWLVATLLVLVPMIALRWRQLVRGGTDRLAGLRRPLVMQLHRVETIGLLDSDPDSGSAEMIRRRPNWMQPRAALRNAGPASPVLALRIALGGHYLPKTLGSHLRTTAIALLQIVSMCLVFTLVLTDKHGVAFLQTSLALSALAFIGGSCLLGGPMLALLIGAQLHQRWQRANAELPLLALLPGLGDVRERRHHLLQATLKTPAIALAMLLLIVLASAWALHLRELGLLLVALPIPASLGVIAMLVLRLVGGRPLSSWGAWLLFVPLAALFVLSIVLPIVSLASHATSVAASSWLLTAWGVLALVLAWLAQRGWRAFIARLHPFLPNHT